MIYYYNKTMMFWCIYKRTNPLNLPCHIMVFTHALIYIKFAKRVQKYIKKNNNSDKATNDNKNYN